MIRLIGILIVVIGLAFRFNALLVILVAAFATGIAGDMHVVSILQTIGDAFTTNRYMSIFILILPVFGLLERHGLREKAENLVRSMKAATPGRIMLLYMLFRQFTAAFGLYLNGHPTMIRPIVSPMSEGAAGKWGKLSIRLTDYVKGMAAASENYGNFYGQLLFVAAGGLLLIKGVFDQAGYSVDLLKMTRYAIPTAVAAYLVAIVRYFLMDARVRKEAGKE